MMNEVWTCSAGDRTLVVQCRGVLTAYEVRQYAARKLGVDPSGLDVRPANVEGAARPTVEVRWEGSDYAHGGTPGGRRLQERAVGSEVWVDT